MNKYQSIVLIVGFVLITITWVWGSSKFQTYQGSSGGRKFPIRSIVEQRIDQKTLLATVGVEFLFLGGVIKILGSKNEKRQQKKG